MTPTLYFLRSSEQKIAKDMLHYAYRLDELSKTLDDVKDLEKFHTFYGLTKKDLGLYALVDNQITGAIWVRLLQDSQAPVLTIAVKPKFRNQGIGSAMMKQLLLELGTVFEDVSVSVLANERTVKWFENFGFTKIENSESKSPVDGLDTISMIKNIANKEVVRPTDGYDPTRWIE